MITDVASAVRQSKTSIEDVSSNVDEVTAYESNALPKWWMNKLESLKQP